MDRPEPFAIESTAADLLECSEAERAHRLASLRQENASFADAVARAIARYAETQALPTPPAEGWLAVDDEDQDPLLGQQLGDFRLERLIAVGGMGRVYEATQRSPARRVALKVVASRHLIPGAIRRFQREAEALGALEHAGICRIYQASAGTLALEQVPFIAMELVRGAPLDVAARELPVSARVELIALVCDAVEHAHRLGILHRDLKPANVLVEVATDGAATIATPKVLDFGVACLVRGEAGATATEPGQMLGTVPYMSPEQIDGREPDARCDVFALGVMLFEVLAGHRPFARGRVGSSAAADSAIPALPRELPSRRELTVIVAKALAAEPAQRYASAGELGADLRRCLAHEPVHARPPSLCYRLTRFARRHRGALLALAIVVAGLATAASLALTWATRDRAGRWPAECAAALRATQVALDTGDLPAALAGLARVPPERRGFEWKYLSGIGDEATAVWTVPDSTGADGAPRWLAHDAATGHLVLEFATARLEVDPTRGSFTVEPHQEASSSSTDARSNRPVEAGTFTATCGDFGVRLTHRSDPEHSLRLAEAARPAQVVAFAAEARFLVAATGAVLTVWDVATGAVHARLRGHTATITGLAVGRTGALYSCGHDRTLREWSLEGDRDGVTARGPGVRFWRPGEPIVCHDGERARLELLDPRDGSAYFALTDVHEPLPRCATPADRRVVVVASTSEPGRVEVRDGETGAVLVARTDVPADYWWLSVDEAGMWAALGYGDGTVRLLAVSDLGDRGVIRVGAPPEYGVFSPDGKTLAVTYRPAGLAVYRVADQTRLCTADTAGRMPIYPTYSDDGHRLHALHHVEWNLSTWNAHNGALLRSAPVASPMYVVRIPGAGRLAIGGANGTVAIYSEAVESTDELTALLTLEAPGEVHAVAAAADGSALAAYRANDTPLTIWRLFPPRSPTLLTRAR